MFLNSFTDGDGRLEHTLTQETYSSAASAIPLIGDYDPVALL